MTSPIEWLAGGKTWNPVRGCSRASRGCENCYAERTANRFKGPGRPYEGLVRLNKSRRPVWTGVAREVPSKLAEPLSWRRSAWLRTEEQRGWDGEAGSDTPAGADAVLRGRVAHQRGEPRPQHLRVFVNSMSDLFHKDVSFEFIAAVFGVMAACPDTTFLLLTKRPARMLEFFGWLYTHGVSNPDIYRPDLQVCEHYAETLTSGAVEWEPRDEPWPLPNVHIGVSVEDQQRADERIPLLLKVPAAVRWVSCEPLLGPVDLGPWMGDYDCHHCGARFWGDEFNARRFASLGVTAVQFETDPDGDGYEDQRYVCPRCGGADFGTGDVGRVDEDDFRSTLDWVVLGGESGPGARPYNLAWARSLIEQCQGAGVRVFHKQLGAGESSWCGERRGWMRRQPNGRNGWLYEHKKGADMSEWPSSLRVREFPEVKP